MTREDLINQITEEINVGDELGHSLEFTARNIVSIFEGSRKHLDYNLKDHKYEWEEM